MSANNASCGEFSTAGPASNFDVELDQYQPAPGQSVPYDTFGAQFDCTNPAFEISGTIAYNIVPTDPADGYYIFGQAGEITGFGNDNYLAYLDGAQYIDLNCSDRRPGPDDRRRRVLDGRFRRWCLRQRRRRLLRVDGQPDAEQAGRGHGRHARREGLLVRGLRRWDLRLR